MYRFVSMIALLVALLVATIWSAPVSAGIVFSDHFTTSTLDPAWNVTLENATGWNYTTPSPSGTHLVVDDILGEQGNNTYGVVNLARSFQPLNDFQLRFDFSWDSAGRIDAMQWLYVRLLDANGLTVAYAGYQDAWYDSTGSRDVSAGSSSVGSQFNSLPLSDTASVEIERVGTAITIDWNGQQIVSGISAAPVTQVQLLFFSYNYSSGAVSSTFGSESVDLVSLSAPGSAAVPEPTSCAIWALAGTLLSVGAFRRRRRSIHP
jgi:hypothetical protein